MIFSLLDYNEIHEKQKFSSLAIVESQVKGCRCNFGWHNSTSFFNSMMNISIFRRADKEP